jgi:aspartyl-tRNA(Asn)/glutamyl-tRNA(Gln) amidotransferase subunit A
MEGCWPLAPSYDTGGPMTRDVTGALRMMELLVPGLAAEDVDLEDVTVGIGWLDLADPHVRARVKEATAHFPKRQELDLPLLQHETYDVFAREAADVHRDLFAEHRDEYGDNVRTKIERCLAVTDEAYERALQARRRYVEDFEQAAFGVDLVLTPTLECVAPPVGIGDLALRERLIELTYPFNAVGWPSLALPCGEGELGLPASVSISAPRGRDAYVLGAALALEAALSAST